LAGNDTEGEVKVLIFRKRLPDKEGYWLLWLPDKGGIPVAIYYSQKDIDRNKKMGYRPQGDGGALWSDVTLDKARRPGIIKSLLARAAR
jgi:hypothetical protein